MKQFVGLVRHENFELFTDLCDTHFPIEISSLWFHISVTILLFYFCEIFEIYIPMKRSKNVLNKRVVIEKCIVQDSYPSIGRWEHVLNLKYISATSFRTVSQFTL